jgi:hypothetical protein
VERRIGLLSTIVATIVSPAFATQTVNPSDGSSGGNQATISADSKVWSHSLFPGSQVGVTIDTVDGQKVGAGTSKVSVDPVESAKQIQ